MTDHSLIHHFEPGDLTRPILLLHGTGGDEHDLVPLAQAVAPGRALLSPRGRVKEGHANRFFRRFAEGRFDIPDLKAQTDALAAFIGESRASYGLGKPIALGFSNGANIAASLLMRHPGVLAGAVLLRAMVPFDEPASGLEGTDVLLVSGVGDPILPVDNAKRLAALLSEAGASVDHEILPAGHGLTQADMALSRAFFERR